MTYQTTTVFQRALDLAETLPEHQQENLLDILHKRLAETRRDTLARAVIEARRDFKRGAVKRGTVDDLLRDMKR